MNNQTNNSNEYKIDWDKYKARSGNQVVVDTMSTCYHSNITPTTCSKILFSAGHCISVKRITKFYDGRTKFLMNKRAIELASDDSNDLANQSIQDALQEQEEAITG